MAYDFPASPTTGQVYAGWSYDGEKWISTVASPNTAGVIGIQVFTASGSYTPSANMTTCVIEAVGGGGGGGGSPATAAGQFAAGSGGSGGSYSQSTLTAAQVGASQAVTIGAGGAGVSGGAGGNGNASSFGALVTAPGGVGGQVGQAGASAGGSHSAPGAAGTGTIAIRGFAGNASVTSYPNYSVAGVGGASGAGMGSGGATANLAGAGVSGANYGGGGGGANINASSAAQPGGAGAPGVVIITEYGMTALASGAAQGNVRYDLAQGLTANQMAQARSNIAVTKRNFLINGAFQINQGGYVSAAVLAAAAYGHDQWKAGASGGDYSFTQSAGNTTITIAAGKSLIQPIEDVRVTGGGSYVLAWTGTAQARAGVNTLTPAGSYAASPLLITGQTDGTVMSVEFNTGTLGNVSLTEGSVAPPFQLPDYASELALCQRYFNTWKTVNSYEAIAGGRCNAPTDFRAMMYYPTMRSAPTMSASAVATFAVGIVGAAIVATAVTTSATSIRTMEITITCASGLTAGQGGTLMSNAAAIAWINLTARL